MDATHPFFHGNKLYQCIGTQYNVLNEARQNKLQIFTDGSKIHKNETSSAGCGFAIYGLDCSTGSKITYEQSTYLGSMSTVFQAEVYAIGCAAHYLSNHRELLLGIQGIDIVTDSKSALQALDSITTSSKLVIDCKKELDRLQEIVAVKIHWIKAHVGHEGNEKADQLAKHGTSKKNYNTEPILPVPKTWVKGRIRQYLLQEWTNRWIGNGEARQTKLFFPEPNGKITKKLLTYRKQSCAQIFRWISGHSFHRYHNNLLYPDMYVSPKCRMCEASKEETSHLFAYCPGLAHIRMRICGQPILDTPFSWSPTQLNAMIQEIDKICPEEGMVYDPANTQTQGDNPGSTNE
jgi:ribonuclease HI